MISGSPKVMDASAIVGLFRGNEALNGFLESAGQGHINLLLPTTAIADAESRLVAGAKAWDAIFMSPGVQPLELTAYAAIEIGPWPGALSIRHAAHEANASGAAVLTCNPAAYAGLRVSLIVV